MSQRILPLNHVPGATYFTPPSLPGGELCSSILPLLISQTIRRPRFVMFCIQFIIKHFGVRFSLCLEHLRGFSPCRVEWLLSFTWSFRIFDPFVSCKQCSVASLLNLSHFFDLFWRNERSCIAVICNYLIFFGAIRQSCITITSNLKKNITGLILTVLF